MARYNARMPSISVIIPTFNRRDMLPRAIDSVLGQTRPPEEVIVVDDGSTDGTADLIRTTYPGVRVIEQRNAGVSAARNRGITNAHGQWIALLDSDDVWLPQKLERQLEALSQHPSFRLVHCDEIWFRNGVRVNPMNKHKKQGGYIFAQCLALCCISPSAVLIESTLFDEVGRFDAGLPACEDYDLWLRICARVPVLYVDEPLLKKYGGHADQLSRKHWGMDRFRVRALEKILATDVLSERNRAAAEATLVEKATILANGAAKRGRADLVTAYRKIANRYRQTTAV